MTRRCLRPRSYLNRTLVVAMAGALTAVTAIPALTAPAFGAAAGRAVTAPPSLRLYGQNFTGATVSRGGWIAGGRRSDAPCLTAGGSTAASGIKPCGWKRPDPMGNGVLRLTGNGQQQSSFVLYTKPLNATDGLNISFDMYQYDTTTKSGGADGIGFVLIDGSKSPAAAGDAGGRLGYYGLTGSYLGIGFDEWGNFSNKAVWGSGPDRLVPDSIVVRGAGTAGYPYIFGVRTAALAADNVATRTGARRHVVIKISTSGAMTISVDFGHGLTREVQGLNLNNVPGQPPLPPSVKFGFTAATGDHTDIHEISHLVIAALKPDLHTTIMPAGKFRAGGSGDLTATVSSDTSGGPTVGTVTALIKLPGALTPTAAGGNGWTCAIPGQQTTCTRNDALRAGGTYPPIDVTTSIADDAPRSLGVQSSADTPDLYLSPGNAARATIPIMPPPPPPNLSVKITPVTQLVAGRPGQLRLDVRNAPKAGRTKGPVTLTYHAPAGSTITAARGKGWTCAVQPAKVVCARPEVLAGGASFPPVYVSMAICRQASCSLRGATAMAQTPGAGPARTVRNLPVAQHSALGLSLSSNPVAPAGGYDTTFTAVVTNGGPTDVTNAQLSVRVPRRFTGRWTCLATRGSGCPGRLGSGQLRIKAYVASGGTVTLTATGQAARAAMRSVPVSATLAPPASYTDLYCSRSAPCTATGDAVAGHAAK